eukprot:TRINITY_DN3864_c0_g1_i1.p1 TRINITY_DN3864_c0_g1~~TRINITY_DN3864_c0_g1_i1.p1  ORF type:complete len:576 (-),score=127.52 TRINITY_DN3864_c0_g1_i1:2569-4296(-)
MSVLGKAGRRLLQFGATRGPGSVDDLNTDASSTRYKAGKQQHASNNEPSRLDAKSDDELAVIAQSLMPDAAERITRAVRVAKAASGRALPGLGGSSADKSYVLAVSDKGGTAHVHQLRLQPHTATSTNMLLSVRHSWSLDSLQRMELVDASGGRCGLQLDWAAQQPPAPLRSCWLFTDAAARAQFALALWRYCQAAARLPQTSSIDVAELRFAASQLQASAARVSDATARERLSAAEERELETLLAAGLGDIDALAIQLGARLSALDASNQAALVAADEPVSVASERLDDIDAHLDALLGWVQHYDQSLTSLQHYIEHLEARNNRYEVASRHQQALSRRLHVLLTKLDLSPSDVKLLAPDLPSSARLQPTSLPAVVQAALRLQRVFSEHSQLPPSLQHLAAVREQMKQLKTVRDRFSVCVAQSLDAQFSAVAQQHLDPTSKSTRDGLWRKDGHAEGLMGPLSLWEPLVHWLHTMDRAALDRALLAYCKAVKHVYKKELKDYFAELRTYILKQPRDIRKQLHGFFSRPGKSFKTGGGFEYEDDEESEFSDHLSEVSISLSKSKPGRPIEKMTGLVA